MTGTESGPAQGNRDKSDAAVAALSAEGVAAYCLGEIVPGDEGVVLW